LNSNLVWWGELDANQFSSSSKLFWDFELQSLNRGFVIDKGLIAIQQHGQDEDG
jgi:hypothetical protein